MTTVSRNYEQKEMMEEVGLGRGECLERKEAWCSEGTAGASPGGHGVAGAERGMRCCR